MVFSQAHTRSFRTFGLKIALKIALKIVPQIALKIFGIDTVFDRYILATMIFNRLKPDLLRSMLLTFALYFAFRGQLSRLREASFYQIDGRGLFMVLLVSMILLGFNAYRHFRGYVDPPKVTDKMPYLMHPKRQWLVLLLMPLLVFVEEFLFRAGLLASLLLHMSGAWALVISALAFVLAHEQALKLDRSNGFLLLYGLAFGAVYIYSGGCFMAAFLVHLAVNLHAWAVNVQLLRQAGYVLKPETYSVNRFWQTVKP